MIWTAGGTSVAPGMPRPAAAGRLLILAVAVLVAAAVQPPTSRAEASQQTTATTTAAAGATPAPGPVVATADKGDLPGVTLTVNQLRRSDPNTVTVVFTIANKDAEAFLFDWTWGELGVVKVGDVFAFDVSGVYLVEPQGKKKYLVLRDANNRCICSTGIYRAGEAVKGLDRGKEATMFAKFPAPPPSVSTVAVAVPHFPVLDNLPLAS
jgi:hypothetical protein